MALRFEICNIPLSFVKIGSKGRDPQNLLASSKEKPSEVPGKVKDEERKEKSRTLSSTPLTSLLLSMNINKMLVNSCITNVTETV